MSIICISCLISLLQVFRCLVWRSCFRLVVSLLAQQMNQSPLIMPTPERVRVDRPATWLSPHSVTPEERPALLHETEGSCRSSQIADAPKPFAVSKRPLAKPLLTHIRMSDSFLQLTNMMAVLPPQARIKQLHS